MSPPPPSAVPRRLTLQSSSQLAAVLWTLHALAVISPYYFTVPDPLAALAAGSVYLPLALFEALGVPVLGSAESHGWSAPTTLGMVLLAAFWAAIWLALAATIDALRKLLGLKD